MSHLLIGGNAYAQIIGDGNGRVLALYPLLPDKMERTLVMNGEISYETWFGDEVTPKLFEKKLNAGAGNVTVWINSPGGDVFAAAQIYNMLMEYKGDTQSQLKDVNKLLKLDPGNEELMAQKQRLLSQAVSETKEKLMPVTAAVGGLGAAAVKVAAAVVAVIGWIHLAIGAVVAIIVVLWNKCDWFREAVIAVWEAIQSATIAEWNAVKEFLVNLWNGIVETGKTVWNGLASLFGV